MSNIGEAMASPALTLMPVRAGMEGPLLASTSRFDLSELRLFYYSAQLYEMIVVGKGPAFALVPSPCHLTAELG